MVPIRSKLELLPAFCSQPFDNPPINLIGPALVHDLVDLLDKLEHDRDIHVIVFVGQRQI